MKHLVPQGMLRLSAMETLAVLQRRRSSLYELRLPFFPWVGTTAVENGMSAPAIGVSITPIGIGNAIAVYAQVVSIPHPNRSR